MATHGNGNGNAKDEKAPRSGQTRRTDVLETAAELTANAIETASAPCASHAAPLGGIELLVEIAKLAEQVLATRTPAKMHHAEPVDPRRCLDPRKRILPR